MPRASHEPPLFGVSESANVCALFASTFPERCERLVLFTPYETAVDDGDEERIRWITDMREHWGERAWMETFAEGISPAYRSDPIVDGLVRLDAAGSRQPGSGC